MTSIKTFESFSAEFIVMDEMIKNVTKKLNLFDHNEYDNIEESNYMYNLYLGQCVDDEINTSFKKKRISDSEKSDYKKSLMDYFKI